MIGSEFNGNKARKLAYFLDTNLNKFKRIISYGSSQSNAMASLSVFAKIKNIEFIYITDHISDFLCQNPHGNYAFALQNGAKILFHKNRAEFAKNLATNLDLLIPEGVAMSEAEMGFKSQAKQISDFMEQNNIKFDVFLPSGTGVSAAFLAKNLPNCTVFTTPCVGDEKYLKKQISEFCDISNLNNLHILNTAKKYHFAKPNLDLIQIWQDLLTQTNIKFELIYDPVGWICVFENLSVFKNKILYIHQGGLSGTQSQLLRYKRKNMI